MKLSLTSFEQKTHSHYDFVKPLGRGAQRVDMRHVMESYRPMNLSRMYMVGVSETLGGQNYFFKGREGGGWLKMQ